MNFVATLYQQTRQLRKKIRELLHSEPTPSPLLPLPLKQYQRLLYANLAYHRALETALAQQQVYLPGYDRLLQCRTPYLVADLLATGAPIPQQYPAFFDAWSSWQLMGAAYVGEGLASEAEEVCDALQENPLLPPMARTSRFFSIGANADTMKQYLANRASGHEDEIIQGVRQAVHLYCDLTDTSDRETSDRETSDRPD
jgi:hypothetical protein